jgi:hypothetical protein
MTDTIIVDPSLAPPAPRVSIDGKRFFGVDDGGASYWIVARDPDHAKRILLDAGVEFTDDDGDTSAIDDPRFAMLDWVELPAERAAETYCWSEDGCGEHKPLTQYAIGDWFCSEY